MTQQHARARGKALLAILTILTFAPVATLAQRGGPNAQPATVTLTDQVATLGGVAGTLTGTLTTTIGSIAGQLVAVGNITGTFTPAGGGAAQAVNQTFAALLTIPTATCTILDLDIGAIHLDLLGLVLDIAPIHIDLVAEPGPGNLLGNLLCAVANLLNPGGGASNALANLLNQILGLLG